MWHMQYKTIITIDGPTASGKSSAAHLAAQKLGMKHLNSGLVYRALAYLLQAERSYGSTSSTRTEFENPNSEDIGHYLNPEHLHYFWDADGLAHVSWKDWDMTGWLKVPDVDRAASILSTNTKVREAINVYLNHVAQQHAIVADGRDCGTVVFPQAQFKFFLTASVEVRAQRWRLYQKKYGLNYTEEEAIKIVSERDERDSNRSVAPLTVAPGAIVIDNSHLSMEETVAEIVLLCQKL